ncbi:MAG: VOC family protein [Flavobacteriales bacterium]|jgi:uncharacterized glyoxalase superfamily protein PhnB|nr:VOC family protein [Flavobacteriales bacterium]
MSAKQVIPALTYVDAKAAIKFLCSAFGFEEHLVVPGEGNVIHHAQLKLGTIMIMLGSSNKESEYSKLVRSPQELNGVVTQSPYIIVDDPDSFYAKAKAHGARIVVELKDEDYGGRGFTCADPEGHLWNFGSYDPWADQG